MWPIRVLVADDCPIARGLIQSILEQDPRIKVVAAVGNGQEALHWVQKESIDLLSLDINMPVMDGLETITRIMACKPLPIVVISGTAGSETAFKALSRGALEVIAKDEIDYEHPQVFRRKIMLLSTVKVKQQTAAKVEPAPTPPGNVQPLFPRIGVVVIASSTGGPKVLAAILRGLPKGFPCPVLIAQHIVPGFIHSLIKWHSGLTPLPIVLAKAGERPQAGTIYYAQPEYHLTLNERGEFVLTAPTAVEFFCPAGDKLLTSAAQVYGKRTIAIVLTGIGEDGARGAGAVHAAGGVVIAQDAATSIVYGMPKAVADAGFAHHILPAGEIDGMIVRLLSSKSQDENCRQSPVTRSV
ncbi:MAG: chemotaxis protein CheB [Magnetococcales bacterium]|nr:chemotaxis protein CheB [Magnetococcales bacterium]